MRGKSFRNSQPIDESSLQKEVEELNSFKSSGYIITDFPNSLEQAHELEHQLSGFLPKIDREACEREEKLKNAKRIVTPSDKPLPPSKLIESGLDQVIWLETDTKECRRRALGWWVDIENDTEFHIDDNPPPTTQAPLCERLMPVIEPDKAEEIIPDKHLAFDLESKKLDEWLKQFGYEDENERFELCHKI